MLLESRQAGISENMIVSNLVAYVLSVMDEANFVLHYPRFALERKHLFDQYFIINQVFDILNVNEKIMYIFNLYDKHHLTELGKFVYTAFTIHNNSIDK